MERCLIALSEVAKLMGVSTATVNYYTNLGLLRVAERKGNSRLYDKKEVLSRFEEIKQFRKQGYPLKLIFQKMTEKV